MTILSAETERLLGEFAGKTDVTSDQVDNLRSVIAGSPVLAKQVDAAIAAGYLERFELLPATSNAGGTYETGTKSINLPASSLSTPAAPDRFDAAEVTFVLGHEIQHGFNDADVERAYVQFDADVEQIAGRTTSHDYTEAIGTLLAANRRDEASSNIAGWNALVSQVRASNPDATLRDLYEASTRSTDVIQSRPGPPITYAPHPELTLNADLTISPPQPTSREWPGTITIRASAPAWAIMGIRTTRISTVSRRSNWPADTRPRIQRPTASAGWK